MIYFMYFLLLFIVSPPSTECKFRKDRDRSLWFGSTLQISFFSVLTIYSSVNQYHLLMPHSSRKFCVSFRIHTPSSCLLSVYSLYSDRTTCLQPLEYLLFPKVCYLCIFYHNTCNPIIEIICLHFFLPMALWTPWREKLSLTLLLSPALT